MAMQHPPTTNGNFMVLSAARASQMGQNENSYLKAKGNPPYSKAANYTPNATLGGFKNFGPSDYGQANVILKNKKNARQNGTHLKNQSVQLNPDGLDNSLTAQEAATFYSNAMNTQIILNSRRGQKRFGAGSATGNINTSDNSNSLIGAAAN